MQETQSKMTAEQIGEKELLAKIEILRNVHQKTEAASDKAEGTEESLEEMLAGIPREELRQDERHRIEIYRTSNLAPEIVKELVAKDVELILLSYMDNREYLGMPNRQFVEYKIYQFLDKLVEKDEIKTEDLYKVARLNFDMNGLKALNDIGTHSSGNDGLSIFANIIKSGDTIKWLQSQGIECAASAEGGDEFGLILYGDQDLRPLIQEIEERLTQEVKEAKADRLIDFESEATKQELDEAGIKIPENFQFKIGTSVGSSIFGEALATVDLSDAKDFDSMTKKITNEMFQSADTRAQTFKKEDKAKTRIENPTLADLWDIREIKARKRFEKEIKKLNEQITSLEATISSLEETIERNSFAMTVLRGEKDKLQARVTELEITLLKE